MVVLKNSSGKNAGKWEKIVVVGGGHDWLGGERMGNDIKKKRESLWLTKEQETEASK